MKQRGLVHLREFLRVKVQCGMRETHRVSEREAADRRQPEACRLGPTIWALDDAETLGRVVLCRAVKSCAAGGMQVEHIPGKLSTFPGNSDVGFMDPV